MKLITVCAFASLLSSSIVLAQVDIEALPSKNSTLKIPVYEQLYKVRVWRDIDLQEKQNKGFFAKGNEISRVLIEAINTGKIEKVYESDSLNEKTAWTKEKFKQIFDFKPAADYKPFEMTKDYVRGNYVKYKGIDYKAMGDGVGIAPDDPRPDIKDYWEKTLDGKAQSYEPASIFKMEIVEDLIFDKRRSRLYYDIIAIRLIGYNSEVGSTPLGWIRYTDAERVFRQNPEKSVWFNRQNTAQNRNFADAFLLRLFHGTISKVENPDNDDLATMYGNYRDGVLAREWEEMKLMEKEHNLWEY